MGRHKDPSGKAALERALKFAPSYQWQYEIVWKNDLKRSHDIQITAIRDGKIAAQVKVSDLLGAKNED